MVNRSNDLKKLEAFYSSKESSLTFVYGSKGCEKEQLFVNFAKGKRVFYYHARQCSLDKQTDAFCREASDKLGIKPAATDYDKLFDSIALTPDKTVIIIDEAQYIFKKNSVLFDKLISLKKNNATGLMIIIASSSIVWAEQDFPELMGNTKKYFDEFMKLTDLSFLDIVRAFPTYSVADCVACFGIIGGVNSYLNKWDAKSNIKKNVCNLILNTRGELFAEAENFISTELRELSCYETILSSLAAGNEKLNDLFEDTGYSRAKISVYLKNLAEFDVVEKVVSFETGGWDNTKKGVYRISNPFINFWFTFVYPNLSEVYLMEPESFYNKYITPGLNKYLQQYFINVCSEYLQLLDMVGQLPIKLERTGTWLGKENNIDIIGQNSIRENVVGICNWSDSVMAYASYEKLLETMKLARISAKTIYLFSATKFDEKLIELSKENPAVVLVDMTEL